MPGVRLLPPDQNCKRGVVLGGMPTGSIWSEIPRSTSLWQRRQINSWNKQTLSQERAGKSAQFAWDLLVLKIHQSVVLEWGRYEDHSGRVTACASSLQETGEWFGSYPHMQASCPFSDVHMKALCDLLCSKHTVSNRRLQLAAIQPLLKKKDQNFDRNPEWQNGASRSQPRTLQTTDWPSFQLCKLFVPSLLRNLPKGTEMKQESQRLVKVSFPDMLQEALHAHGQHAQSEWNSFRILHNEFVGNEFFCVLPLNLGRSVTTTAVEPGRESSRGAVQRCPVLLSSQRPGRQQRWHDAHGQFRPSHRVTACAARAPTAHKLHKAIMVKHGEVMSLVHSSAWWIASTRLQFGPAHADGFNRMPQASEQSLKMQLHRNWNTLPKLCAIQPNTLTNSWTMLRHLAEHVCFFVGWQASSEPKSTWWFCKSIHFALLLPRLVRKRAVRSLSTACDPEC